MLIIFLYLKKKNFNKININIEKYIKNNFDCFKSYTYIYVKIKK